MIRLKLLTHLIILVGIGLSIPLSNSNSNQSKDERGHQDIVWCVAVAPDGTTALSGSEDETIKRWDLTTGELLWSVKAHQGGVNAVAVSPNGKTALSGGHDGAIKLWELATGNQIGDFKAGDEVSSEYGNAILSVAFSPDGKTALSGSMDYTTRLWDVETKRNIHTFRGQRGPIKFVGFSADQRIALSAGSDWTNGAKIKLWDISTGQKIKEIGVGEDFVRFAALLPDAKRILSGQQDTLKLWDADTGKNLLTINNESYVDAAALSPDGTTAVSGSRGGVIKVWSLRDGTLIRRLEGHKNTVYSLTFSPDGKHIISGSADWTLKLWDLDSGQIIHSFPESNGPNQYRVCG